MGATCQGQSDPENVIKDFRYDLSTEDNYGVPHFVGDNQDIRPLLDYTYHRTYSASRVKTQDGLITQLSGECKPRSELMLPWVIFTAGAMGAGKGYVIRWMDQKGYLPIENFITVDPDAIRQAMPEWPGYVGRDSEMAGNHTQKEAGLIAEMMGYKALRNRSNVIFDGSLRDARWYTKYFLKLRDEFPGIRIMILHIYALRAEVLQRAEDRGKKTGRVIPPSVLIESMDAVPASVQALAPYADFVCRVVNSDGKEPEIQRELNSPHPPETVDLNWDLLNKLWGQLDADGDGSLSAAEIQIAIGQGLLTPEVVKTLDKDGDGEISRAEFQAAAAQALASGTRRFR